MVHDPWANQQNNQQNDPWNQNQQPMPQQQIQPEQPKKRFRLGRNKNNQQPPQYQDPSTQGGWQGQQMNPQGMNQQGNATWPGQQPNPQPQGNDPWAGQNTQMKGVQSPQQQPNMQGMPQQPMDPNQPMPMNSHQNMQGMPQQMDPNMYPQQQVPNNQGKILKKVLIGVGVIAVLGGGYIAYATPVSEIEPEDAAVTSLRNLVNCMNEYNLQCLQSHNPDSALVKELDYINNNKVRSSFIRAVLGSVSVEVGESQKLNWFNRPATNFKREPIIGETTLNLDGETAKFTYVDYSQINFTKKEMKALAKENNLSSDDVEYSRKLTDLFALYMIELGRTETGYPLKVVERRPFIMCEGEGKNSSCQVSPEEELYWDETLLSSDEFLRLQDEFAETMADALGIEPLVSEEPEEDTEEDEETVEKGEKKAKGKEEGKEAEGEEKAEEGKKPPKEEPAPEKNQDKPVPEPEIKPAALQEPLPPKKGNPEPKPEGEKVEEAPKAEEEKAEGDKPEESKEEPKTPEDDERDEELTEEEGESLGGWLGSEEESESSLTPARKYADKYYLEENWVGVARLSKEINEAKVNPITGEVEDNSEALSRLLPKEGNGTFEEPAGLGTPVVTHQAGKDGKPVPLEVTLVDFKLDQDAIRYMETRSPMNRGFTTKSDIVYAYYKFNVKNLSGQTVSVAPNDSLSDPQRNLTNRTGTVYGLSNFIEELPPEESKTIESWTASPRIDNLFLIWGADFQPDDDPVWFKVLAANPEQKIEDSQGEPETTPTEEVLEETEE